MKTEHEVLVEARNLIAREGWWQNDDSGFEGHCVANAVGDVECESTKPKCRAWDRLVALIAPDATDVKDHAVMWCWNDAPERTLEDVLALFDEAIRLTAPAPDTSFLLDRIAEREQNEAFYWEIFEEAKS